KLLDALHGALPKMSLIASDFNYIPNVKEPGERAALVSTNDDVDIFFQTDFVSVIGNLKITIIQGTNLDVRDMLSSDHYVVVSLEKLSTMMGPAMFEMEMEGIVSACNVSDQPELNCTLCKQVMKNAALTSK
ncbi:hypothetical protein Tco_0718991, partial [Tanacetum coccineum]